MTVKTYRARYRLDIGEGFREPGDLAPEAVTWVRLDDWLHFGRITEAEVEEDELRAAVQQYCPELAEEIYQLAGIAEGVELEGPRRTPRRVSEPTEEPTEGDPEVQTLKPARKKK